MNHHHTLPQFFVCFLFAALLSCQPSGEPIDPEALFQAHFEPHPIMISESARSGEVILLRREFIQAYEGGEYARALRALGEMNARDKLGMAVPFYEANCYLALGEPGKAIGALNEARQAFGSFSEYVPWYDALAHLKVGETETAQSLLDYVVKQGRFKATDAQALLERL